ncbi:hypothetical protein NC652_020601 [Populus alba x Populus x berolinensis]|nr:hypothetical protein NC652_020601 [Populus alba x Populus x berolinensis]
MSQLAEGTPSWEETSSPLGFLLIIFESRPDALVQSEVGLDFLLKEERMPRGQKAILQQGLVNHYKPSQTLLGGKLIGLVTSRDEIPDLRLSLMKVIDLVNPRGSSKLVSKIKSSTKIPVLGHAGDR